MSRSTVGTGLVGVAWDDGGHDEPQGADAPAGADRCRGWTSIRRERCGADGDWAQTGLPAAGCVSNLRARGSHFAQARPSQQPSSGCGVRSRPSSWWKFGTAAEVHKAAAPVEILSAVVRRAAIDGMADCAAATALPSSPAPSAHRCAAAGLDSSTAAERLASMPSTAQWIA
jgi:hypothetical protein